MRIRLFAMVLCLVFATHCLGQPPVSTLSMHARLALPVEQRLDVPLNFASKSLRLTDFVSLIATSYKVPVLAEVVAPAPDVRIPAGTHTARQLLNAVIGRLPGYGWNDADGVAHIFQTKVRESAGNVLNLPTNYFYFPPNVQQFEVVFRSCVWNYAHDRECDESAIKDASSYFSDLRNELLPNASINDASVGSILFHALRANNHFYVLMAYPSENPILGNSFVFDNWFFRSLVPDSPSPIRIQALGKGQ